MNLPRRESAYVPREKVTDYLLSETHPVGMFKARFLRAAGFDDTNLDLLEQGLLRIAREEEVTEVVPSPFGTKFIIEGMLITPRGVRVGLRTVWIIETNDDHARFVTAYPV